MTCESYLRCGIVFGFEPNILGNIFSKTTVLSVLSLGLQFLSDLSLI